ncbi:DNA-directed RNA polymerase III subunit RPC4-like protein [Tanacetum coccineum]
MEKLHVYCCKSQNYKSYYPITLPLRRPCSVNPEVLDAQEFGEEKEYVETKMNTASKIGLSVSPGIIGECKQDAAMFNTKAGHCCVLGSIDKECVATPDVNSLSDNINNL